MSLYHQAELRGDGKSGGGSGYIVPPNSGKSPQLFAKQLPSELGFFSKLVHLGKEWTDFTLLFFFLIIFHSYRIMRNYYSVDSECIHK